MMYKIAKNKYINTDYIVSLVSSMTVLQARLIDNSTIDLFHGDEKDLERQLEQMTKEINVCKMRAVK